MANEHTFTINLEASGEVTHARVPEQTDTDDEVQPHDDEEGLSDG